MCGHHIRKKSECFEFFSEYYKTFTEEWFKNKDALLIEVVDISGMLSSGPKIWIYVFNYFGRNKDVLL